MKNIHVLPTDKPSKLFYLASNLHLEQGQLISPKNYQNIYITSDEEIKKGDWCYDDFLKSVFQANSIIGVKTQKTSKKIILTTDQDLIKDGVQAIDDEFLEWFVRNPSCEEVEVQKWSSLAECGYSYHIIIPKEEQCTCKVGEPYNNLCCKVHGNISKEEPKFGDSIENTINIMNIANSVFGVKEEPKQETLEEAAEVYAKKQGDIPTTKLEDAIFKQGFIDGAKWQVERMYSEEESIKKIIDYVDFQFNTNGELNTEIKKWFEHYKM